MGQVIELIKKDRIVQVMLGLAGLLFFVVLFKGKKETPPQPQRPQVPQVQANGQTKPVGTPEQVAKPPASAFEVPFTPEEQAETEVEKLKKMEQNAQPQPLNNNPSLTQDKAENQTEQKQKAEQKAPEQNERNEKKKEVVKSVKEKRSESHRVRKTEGKPAEKKAEKTENREGILSGYVVVCVVGGSCALYDAQTGQSYRQGSEIKGWTIERLSPQGAVLRKGNMQIREDF